AVLAGRAFATTADDLCSPGATACEITTARTVTNHCSSTTTQACVQDTNCRAPACPTCGPTETCVTSVLDFGTRALTIQRRGSLDSTSGQMTIRAGTLTLASGSALLARGATVEPKGSAGSISIETIGGISISNQARIDVSNSSGGGLIDINAGGNVDIL